nr:hypothetical protein C5F59_39155 [Streptomyces sp. QL37]
MMLVLIVALALGGSAVYAAYRNERFGSALLVGLAVVTAFFFLMEKGPSALSQTVAPSTLLPSVAPAQSGLPSVAPAQSGLPSVAPAQPGSPSVAPAQSGSPSAP